MEDLILALTIMASKGEVSRPTFCDHDELHVYPKSMDFTDEQIEQLECLGFFPNDMGGFSSFKYGSC